MQPDVSETAILTTTREILDGVAKRMKKECSARIAIIGFTADAVAFQLELKWKRARVHAPDAAEERRCCQVAAQRAVNAKAYLVRNHGIDPARILVRVARGHSGVAEIVQLPSGSNDNGESPWLGGTSPIDEDLTKPLDSDLVGEQLASNGGIDGQ